MKTILLLVPIILLVSFQTRGMDGWYSQGFEQNLQESGKLISPYAKKNKNSSEIHIKAMCGETIIIPRWQLKEMRVLHLLLEHQKSVNVLDLSSFHYENKDIPYIARIDIESVSKALTVYKKNQFEDYCDQFITSTRVTNKNCLFKYTFGLNQELRDLINASYKIGANRIFQLCARHVLTLDMQKKVVSTPIDPMNKLVRALDERIGISGRMGSLLCDIKKDNETASMLNFIFDCLRQKIIKEKISKRTVVIDACSWKINSVAIDPDSTMVVSAGWGFGNNLMAWDLKTQKQSILQGHPTTVTKVIFNPCEPELFSLGIEGEILVWDTQNLELKRQINSGLLNPTCAAFNKAGTEIVIGSGTSENNLIILDSKTGKIKYKFVGHANPITCVGFSPDEKRIVSISQDGRCKIWRIATQEVLKEYHEADCSSCSIENGENNTWFLTGCRKKIGYWFSYDLDNEKIQNDSFVPLKSRAILPTMETVVHVPKSKYIFVSDTSQENNIITIFSLLTGNVVTSLEGHKNKITDIACSNDGSLMVSGSKDAQQNCIIWILLTKEEREIFRIISELHIEQVGLIYDLCLADQNGFPAGVKEDSSDCKTFDILPIRVQNLLRDCILKNNPVIDEEFLLMAREEQERLEEDFVFIENTEVQ